MSYAVAFPDHTARAQIGRFASRSDWRPISLMEIRLAERRGSLKRFSNETSAVIDTSISAVESQPPPVLSI
jgi:hypothetical protein